MKASARSSRPPRRVDRLAIERLVQMEEQDLYVELGLRRLAALGRVRQGLEALGYRVGDVEEVLSPPSPYVEAHGRDTWRRALPAVLGIVCDDDGRLREPLVSALPHGAGAFATALAPLIVDEADLTPPIASAIACIVARIAARTGGRRLCEVLRDEPWPPGDSA